ncbi:MAG: LLM class flavin-dependent oxidoreductase, partial [Gammaproteobacteria bacterium]
ADDTPRHWSIVQPLPAPILTAKAQQAEAQGVHGVYAPQVYGPPFIQLAVAAAATERLQLASGIAIAAARSPFETAMAAIDMDRISGGRFILGLGTSVSAWSQDIFGAAEHRPVALLRETVAAVRHIVAGAHKGLGPFEGAYYRATFDELQPTEPPPREEIPIWIAALRAPLVRLAAQIGDGVIGHPMWSIEWTLDEMYPAFERALMKAARDRSEVEVNIWPWAAINPNEAEAIEDSRATMAFYGGIKQYEPFFEAHGFLDVARKLQEGVQRRNYMSVANLVPDEMVRTFVAVGEPDKVRERIARLRGVADSLCIVPPVYGLGAEKLMTYTAMIGETFYGGS